MNIRLKNSRFGILSGALIISVGLAVTASAFADNVPKNKRTLMKRSVQLEQKIQLRQRSAEKGQKEDSKQYSQGYDDGYNKAVLDLVKAKLLGKPGNLAESASAGPGVNTKVSADKERQEDIGAAELLNGEWDSAIKAASALIMKDPGQIAPYINRSWAYAEKGMTRLAITDANQAVNINPKNSLAHNNRGYALELEGKIVDARAAYQQACDLNYEPACGASLKLGSLAAVEITSRVAQLLAENTQKFNHRDWPAVKSLMTRVLQLDPANSVAFTNRAVALGKLGQLPQALEDSNQALVIQPGFAVAHNNRAYVFELLGNRAKAIEDYSAACKLGVQQSCADYRRLGNRPVSQN